MNYKYFLYGLNVESEIQIEEAYEREFPDKSDVRIVIGDMPKEALDLFEDKSEDEPFVAFSKDTMVYRIPGVGDYWVTKDSITVAPSCGADHQQIRSFLLGSGFGYCMLLRKQVLLHGGAVAKDGKGVIVTGESGAGKSTVTDALLEKGFLFIADDVCSISVEGERPHINMAYPQQKLCRDAAAKKGYDLSELIYINEDRDKYALRLKNGFLPEGADFHYLFEIMLSNEEDLSFREITGHEKLMLILRNIYRGEDGFKFWGVPPEYMQSCLKIAAIVQIYQITRPKGKDTLGEVIRHISTIIGK